jgi:hypothetical protein
MEIHSEEINFDLADIDWFCSINGFLIHVASNGGRLPSNINHSFQELSKQKQLVFSTEAKLPYGVDTNFANRQFGYEYLNDISPESKNEFLKPPDFTNNSIEFNPRLTDVGKSYSWSFIEMAQRGFYSFDRVNEDEYHLVAWPRRSLRRRNKTLYESIDRSIPHFFINRFSLRSHNNFFPYFYKHHLPKHIPDKLKLVDIIESETIDSLIEPENR